MEILIIKLDESMDIGFFELRGDSQLIGKMANKMDSCLDGVELISILTVGQSTARMVFEPSEVSQMNIFEFFKQNLLTLDK